MLIIEVRIGSLRSEGVLTRNLHWIRCSILGWSLTPLRKDAYEFEDSMQAEGIMKQMTESNICCTLVNTEDE